MHERVFMDDSFGNTSLPERQKYHHQATTEKYRAKIHASRNRRVRTISSESVFLAEPRQHHHPQGMVRASEKKSAKIGRSPLASVTYS